MGLTAQGLVVPGQPSRTPVHSGLCFSSWCHSSLSLGRHFSHASAFSLFLWTPGTWVSSSLTSVSRPFQTREKEKMKEAKDARYTNGHLFTTISVSGMTMCYACNKSITAKEALICPSKFSVPKVT